MMRILLRRTNLILVLIIAIVICMVAHLYITNGIVKNKSLLMLRDTTISQNNNSKLTTHPITIKTSVIELFNESVHMSQEEIMEIIYIASGEIAMLGQVWLALYLLTKMLSFYISLAYIKGWLIKVSQITCNKARLDFLHLKAGVKNESSYKYLLTSYTLHSI
jgi:hypothetical protein